MTKSVKSLIPHSELKFLSYSGGVSICKDTLIGLVSDDGYQYKFIEYDCIGKQFKVVKHLTDYCTEEQKAVLDRNAENLRRRQ